MKNVLSFAIILSLVFIGCHKDEPEAPTLPFATKGGANTMGCYINGDLFSCSGIPNAIYGDGVSTAIGPDCTNIGGSASGTIDLVVYGTTFEIDTLYTDLVGFSSGSTKYFTSVPTVEFKVKDNDPFNWVKFSRYDNLVIAGTFQFKGFTAGYADSVVVTQGRFDIAR